MNAMRTLSLVSMLAILHAPVAFGTGLVSDAASNPHHVPGESIDSGLGKLPANYTAAEFQREIFGEKLDSGLGSLPADYTAAEFQRVVYGESLDSGLGDLPAGYTASEFQRGVVRSASASQRQ